MKIAILSCFYPYRGGISQFNTCLFNELGVENDVKAFNFKRQYPDFLFPGKTQFVGPGDDMAVPIETTSLLDTANPFTYVATLREIRAWKPDLLIVRYWMSYFAPSLGYITRGMRGRCKVVSILDNVIPHERHFFDAPLTKYFLGGSDGCITLCEAVAEDLRTLKPEAKCAVIPHPLYSQFGPKRNRRECEEKLRLAHDKKTLLFFGLIREYKGLDILLRAFNELGDDYQLVIAGEPYGSFEKYQQIINASPAAFRIHLYPKFIKDSEVADYFSVADAVVLPYRSATQSGIASVAYHFEVPLVVTDVGGLRETIGERGTGLVAKDCSVASVKAEVLRLFSDPVLRQNCIENIRREKTRLSWSNFCRKLLSFVDTL